MRPAFITWEDEGDYDHPDVLELEQRIDHAKDWFEELLDLFYGKKEFNSTDFQNALDELGGYLGVKLPKKEIAVEIY